MKNPLRHHNHYHRDTGQPFETCWVCGRDRAKCQAKIRFTGWEEANEWSMEHNVSRGWALPYVDNYRCRWCEGWHMKTVKDPRGLARMEKQRRKWLAAGGK